MVPRRLRIDGDPFTDVGIAPRDAALRSPSPTPTRPSGRSTASLQMLALVLILASAGTAAAQTGFDTDPLHPTGEPTHGLTVWSASVPMHLEWTAGLWIDFAYSPIRLAVPDLNLPERDIVDWRGSARLVGLLGLFDFIAVGLELPWVMYQTGLDTEFARDVVGHGKIGDAQIGDISIFSQVILNEQRSAIPAVAMGLRLTLPTASSSTLTGEPGLMIEPVAVVTYNIGPHAITANLAYRLRTMTMRLRDTGIGHQLGWTVGGHYATAVAPIEEPQVLVGEVGGVVPLFENYGPGDKFSLELRAALQQGIMLDGVRSLTLGFGLGVGVLRTPGTPLFRTFFTIGYSSAHPHVDDDRDGIPNRYDDCPQVEEDFDEWEDADGCPEEDNDEDGLEDFDDDCPDEAEDLDDIDDWDGCPDPDYPDEDNDGLRGDQDDCPDEPEDYDGFLDEDGCPDRNNDGDNLLDLHDLCPDAAEDMNGYDDDDGCPDRGGRARLLSIKDNRIRLHQPILFGRLDSRIKPRSLRILDELATFLRNNSEISQLRIEVYPRKRSARWAELASAHVGALRSELEKRGIEPTRLRFEVRRWSKASAGKLKLSIRVQRGFLQPTIEKQTPKKQDKAKKKKKKRKRSKRKKQKRRR